MPYEVPSTKYRCNLSVDFFRTFELGPPEIKNEFSVPTEVLDYLHIAVILGGLSFLQFLGIILNILVFIVFCKDKKNRGSVSLLLQVVAIFDIIYLLSNAAGTTVPVLWQFLVTGNPRSCDLTPYMNIRLHYYGFFQVGLNGTRDVVRWLMIVLSEYTLVPYCCATQAVKKMYNRIFAVIEVWLVLGFVAAINTFDFICGGVWSNDRNSCQQNLLGVHFLVTRFNVFIPYVLVLFMYFTLALLMYVKRGTATDPRPWPFMLQVRRAFAVLTLFLICEAASTIHWFFYWEIVFIEPKIYQWAHFMSGYTMYFLSHFYCAMKFFLYLCVGDDFRKILGKMCCCSGSVELSEQDMHPVLDYDNTPKHLRPDWDQESEDELSGEEHALNERHTTRSADSQKVELLHDERQDNHRGFDHGNQITKV